MGKSAYRSKYPCTALPASPLSLALQLISALGICQAEIEAEQAVDLIRTRSRIMSVKQNCHINQVGRDGSDCDCDRDSD